MSVIASLHKFDSVTLKPSVFSRKHTRADVIAGTDLSISEDTHLFVLGSSDT